MTTRWEHTPIHVYLNIVTNRASFPVAGAEVGEGTKEALPGDELLYLDLSYFVLSFLASCLPKALPSALLVLTIFASVQCSLHAAPDPISFLNLDLVSLSETVSVQSAPF